MIIISNKKSRTTTRKSHTRKTSKGRTSVKQHSVRRKINRDKIIDGDTFDLSRGINGVKRVRIANFNAPEKNQKGGRSATNKLKQTIGDKTITIKPCLVFRILIVM